MPYLILRRWLHLILIVKWLLFWARYSWRWRPTTVAYSWKSSNTKSSKGLSIENWLIFLLLIHRRDHRINPEETAQALGFESFSAFLDSAEASSCVLKENITNQYGVPVCIYKAKPTGTYLPVFQQQKTAEDQAREK